MMITKNEFAKRRQQIMKKIGRTGIVILPAAPVALRNGDYDYPYRQNSDFYYLTGFDEPEAVAIIAPNRLDGEFILFNRIRHREEEIWTGIRAGQAGARSLFGADEAYPISDLEAKLPSLLEGREEIYYTIGLHREFDKILLGAMNKIRGKIRGGIYSPVVFKDVTDTLHEMRLIKSPAEIQLMRKAAEISAAAHIRAMQTCKPGMNEYQLEAEIMYEFQRQGARFPAYTSIVGSAGNSCILHYNENNKIIDKNSIVLVDAGCEYHYYASDITRTFPASGHFSAEQKAIYEIVLAAQLAAIQLIRPGVRWSSMQSVIVKILTEGLVDLGILKGRVDSLIEKEAYLPFYMHKSGHWLGMDVHDVGRYKIDGKWRALRPGMVLTVEPGIYISSDLPGVHKRWHNIGVRIEDDVLVTAKNHDVLSRSAPKKIPEIEALMG